MLAAPVWAKDDIRKETIQFDKGATSASIKGRLRGDADVDYRVRAGAGQTLAVALKKTNPQNYFNILPPGSDFAMFVGQTAKTGRACCRPTAITRSAST